MTATTPEIIEDPSKKEESVKKEDPLKKEDLVKKEESDKKEESVKKEEPLKTKKAKKVKKAKKKSSKKAKKKKKVKKHKKAKAPKDENTTPPCTPPPKIVDLVDYDDDDEDEIDEMEIMESFPLSKDLTKEESPNTEEYVDNWENEEEKTPLIQEEDSFKDGFSTPIFVNPSPPADHKFEHEVNNGSTTPPLQSTTMRKEVSEEPETRIFKPSKVLFGIDDIYSDVLNSINRSQTKKPSTPSSSSSSSSDSEDEIEEKTTTPPLQVPEEEKEKEEKIEPENPYANFSEEDLAKIQKLDENLSKIQSMRSSYGDPADEFCEGLNKMEKFLTTERNIMIQKYSSTPQFLVTLQEAELKEDQSPSVFQSSIKMVISPTKMSKNRIRSSSNLLGSDDDEEVAETVKEEKKVVVVEEKAVKEEKKMVVDLKKERKTTRSPDKRDKDRKSSSKGKSESPSRRRRSRSPKIADKGHRRDRHVAGEIFFSF